MHIFNHVFMSCHTVYQTDMKMYDRKVNNFRQHVLIVIFQLWNICEWIWYLCAFTEFCTSNACNFTTVAAMAIKIAMNTLTLFCYTGKEFGAPPTSAMGV